jgi:hypothetical protein
MRRTQLYLDDDIWKTLHVQFAAAPYFHLRLGASGGAGSLRKLPRQSKTSDDGTRRPVKGPR